MNKRGHGTSDDTLLALSNRVCRIWSIKTKELICSFSAYDVVCMTMNDDHLVLGGRDGRIQVVDFMTGTIVKTTTAFAEEIVRRRNQFYHSPSVDSLMLG